MHVQIRSRPISLPELILPDALPLAVWRGLCDEACESGTYCGWGVFLRSDYLTCGSLGSGASAAFWPTQYVVARAAFACRSERALASHCVRSTTCHRLACDAERRGEMFVQAGLRHRCMRACWLQAGGRAGGA